MSIKPAKKNPKNTRARTSAEVTSFAEVLACEEHNFAAALEELAPKKVASNEVFTYPKSIWPKT